MALVYRSDLNSIMQTMQLMQEELNRIRDEARTARPAGVDMANAPAMPVATASIAYRRDLDMVVDSMRFLQNDVNNFRNQMTSDLTVLRQFVMAPGSRDSSPERD